MTRDFKGVWIPKDIWLDSGIGWSEKLLLVEIESLADNGECFASNRYFGDFFGLSPDRISKLVSNLTYKGYIEVQLIYHPGTKNIKKRVITTTGYRRKQLQGIGENNYTPIGENAEDNNTVFINTVNNTKVTNINTNINQPPVLATLNVTVPEIDFGWDKGSSLHVQKSDVAGTDEKKLLKIWKLEKFSDFWERFKNKKSKAKVETAWLALTKQEIETILEVVDDHVIIYSAREIQHRPHPTTWINQKRWEDDITEELKKFKPRFTPKASSLNDVDRNEW